MLKELQQERGNSGRDADEEVDDDEKDVGGAGHLKPEGGRVHDGGDGPAGKASGRSARQCGRRETGQHQLSSFEIAHLPVPSSTGSPTPALTAHQLWELQNIIQMGSPKARFCPRSHGAARALEGPTSVS